MRFAVADYVEERIGVAFTSDGQSGPQLVCDCPFCGKERKFYVATETGLWVCYRCGEAGSLIRLVVELDGMTWSQAAQAIRAGSERLPCRPVNEALDAMREDPAPAPEPDRLELPSEFVPVWEPVTKTWREPDYLKRRGVHRAIAAAYGLGYCLQGRYGGRLVVPAREFGELVTFQARSMVQAEPKYLNPQTPRGAHVLGLDEAVGASTVAVVEGPFDVLGCARAGVPAVALLGKEATTAQALLLRRAGFVRAVVMLDPEAHREGAAAARVLGGILEALIATLSDDMDPGEASREAIQEAFRQARAPTLRDLFLGATHKILAHERRLD